MPTVDPRRPALGRLVATLATTMLFSGALTTLAIYDAQGNDPLVPEPGDRAAATIVVQNKVVISAHGLVEDRTPVYLSTTPVKYCASAARHCKVPGTEVGTGATWTAVCFTFGDGMTNMNLRAVGARRNPERVSSDLWYGVRLPDGRLGYVSEVYLTPVSRNGLGLRHCPVPGE
jgi:hypothetical protein